MKKWVIENRRTLFRGEVFTVDNLQCRHPVKDLRHDFFIMNTPDWINVVAITEDGHFILVKQHRLGIDEYTLETPAGLVNPGEDPLAAAVRELREETGYTPKEIGLIHTLAANPAIMNTAIHFYCATGCTKTGGQSLDPAEDIEVLLYKRADILTMISDGTLNHSIIITALTMFFLSPFDTGTEKPSFA